MKRSLRLALILSPAVLLPFQPTWSLVYFIFLALVALGKVLYYTVNFNNCKEDAEMLKSEIREAKIDLAKKGFNNKL